MSPASQKSTGPLLRDRFTGCILGGAAGDALGAPVEFMRLSEIRTRFGNAGIRDFVPAYGRLGAITDDTQMTLFTAEAMIRSHMRSIDRGMCSIETVTANAYQRWLLTQGERSSCDVFIQKWPGWLYGHASLHQQRAPGNTCLGALRSASSLGALADNNSKGCGAVMRMAPVGLAGQRFGWDSRYVMQLGANLGHLTHGHPTGYLSAGAFAVMIHAIAGGETLNDAAQQALDCLRRHEGHEETTRAVTLALELANSDAPADRAIRQLGEGWIGEEALAIGFYCAAEGKSLEEGVVLAANIDGDSDSTGSIAGNLLGALHGRDSIPLRWLNALELRDVTEEIAGDLHDCVTWGRDEPGTMGLTDVTRLRETKYPPN